ncbi:MAG: hypothetical protein E7384_06000 [Ruminococcaceae bacterium]|nr:hypothetical protein [Oscillospiraceae bacterium]
MKKDSKEKNKKLIGLAVLALTVILVVVLFFVTGIYKNVFEFLGFDVKREYKADGIAVEFTPHGNYKISGADDTIVIFDENGVTGYDNGGSWKWHNDAKFIDPVLQSYDDFVLIHDPESKIVSAFNSAGIMWSKTFDNKIRNAVAHDGTGFVSIITDSEEYNSEVYIIDYKNNLKDIFSGKFVDEFVVNVSVSPDCSQFALSGFYPEGEKTAGVIMFLRMNDGEVFSTEVSDGIYPYAEYLDGDTLIAANSDSLIAVTKTASVDTKKDKITKLWTRESNSDVLLDLDVLINEGFCVAFGSSDETSGKSMVKYFNEDCKLSESRSFSERVDFVKAGRDSFLLSSDYSVYFMSKSFSQKSTYGSMSDIEIADFINGEKVLVQMQSRLMIVSFTEK